VPGGGGLRERDRGAEGRLEVTVSCAEGDTGYIYDGKMEFEAIEVELDKMPRSR
jgi:pyruvate,water dikinase